MAEAALFGIAKSVLSQLASPALDEFRLLWGHKADLEKLENTVTTISNVLQDADRRQKSDLAVQGWLARLRNALYEADDLFDIISAKILVEKNKVRHFVSKPYRFAFLVKTAHKVKAVRERIDDIARDINGFNFLPVQTNLLDPTSSRIGREETHSYIPKNEVIGREQETEDVVRMLLPDTCQELKGVSVISIIGIGGLGKTTLAKLIYNDERVQPGFDLCMWACINYFTPLKQVLITLLKSATNSAPQDLDLDQLQSLFRKEIEGKRFLLVLDDVWDEDPKNWRELEHLLCSGKGGSKVLTTTRSELVAQCLCATKPYFHLQGMSDENAWLLFKKIAFVEEGNQINSEWEQMGRQIVRKCAYVPLAIVVIASLLRKKGKESWFRLVNDELSSYKEIMDVLEFSYKELPYPVKLCFGYCSLFPKDYEFEKDSLLRLWIAQGFVEPLVNQSLEDRAEEYLFYLVDRCFFQLTIDEDEDEVTCYEMHDLMHDLAKEVAGSESMLVDQTAHVSWDNSVRHVSVYYGSEFMVDHVCSFSHSTSIRTFLCPGMHSLGKNALSKLMSSVKSLRVLDLSNLRIEKLPASIGELIHLRFLDLSENGMERLPGSVCSLCHLQYLILHYCEYLMELPENLGNLRSLRHLAVKGCDRLVKMPAGLAALTSLVTLDRLVVHIQMGGLKYLENLDNLSGSLKIKLPTTGWQNATTDVARSFLSRKSRLHTLHFSRKHYTSSIVSSELDASDTLICALEPSPDLVELQINSFDSREMPRWVGCLHNLVTLKLECCSRCVELPPLSHLPSIKELRISELEAIDTSICALEPPPNLVVLKITAFSCQEIPHWVMCLHNLVTLKLRSCSRCVELPPLSHLPSLKEFCISDMSSTVTIEDNKLYKPNSFYPFLETLSIESMSSLTSWWMQAPTVIPAFPRVTSVVITGCPKLTSCMPLFPLIEDLRVHEVREELIWQVIGKEATSSTSQGNCSVLKSLVISDVVDLTSIGEAQIRHLSALQELCIEYWAQLETVSCGIAYLHSLEKLKIRSFGEYNWVDSEDQKTVFRKIHLSSRLKHLEIPTVNRNLFKGLKFMASLETLIIYQSFNQDLQEEEEDEEEEGMPWKNLQKLVSMKLVFGKTFSMRSNQSLLNGFQHLTSLQELELCNCKELYLSWRTLLGLNHLRVLNIEHVEESIDVDSEIPTVNRNLFKGLKFMASLETLIIKKSFNQELQEGEEEEEGMPWKNLQKLVSMKLVFGKTFSMRSNQSLLNGFQHLTSLRELQLCKCKELYLSWRALLGLNFLWILKIEHVEEVIDVDSDAHTQTQLISSSIRELNIDGGEWVNAIPWKSFPFLEELKMRKLEGLPEGLQHLSALQRLEIDDISECVVSLPHWMSSLSSLRHLFITRCSSELKKRCERLTGEDWPKIQHIRRIGIW